MTWALEPPAEPPPASNRETLPLHSSLAAFRATDSMDPRDLLPRDQAKGKSRAKSLMYPQEWAVRVLPADVTLQLFEFATKGCPADCGKPWSREAIEAARAAGPHVSAMDPDNVSLIWEDLEYQQSAGFARIVPEKELFAGVVPEELKISRVAVVPQAERRGRIILNLSAPVEEPATRRNKKRKVLQKSVNETTADARQQAAVRALGTALPALLVFMFDTDSKWEIDWHKIDLSDGFWRMIVEHGKEYNFVYQLPHQEGDTETHYVVPSSLQMGWKNSPAYFCYATKAGQTLIQRTLAITLDSGIDQPH